ncbi:MAG: hypothetical protein M1378_05870 [Bacteroidetes bacterium]|nr:hypothetical protein [Bacteroidota bacterium]MCL5035392.1 hypothetical protein [Bacteroidota bacterium]
MKKILLAALFASTVLIVPQKTRAQEISFGVFYSSLSPYGRWINNSAYGMCWQPVGVPTWWRPYTYGHWIWTDYGWTWVSNYPWGWATFHYGRWSYDPYYGWIWVPGYVWAPAWVQWRWGGGYAGWAPLPPGFHFRLDAVMGPEGGDFGVGIGGWTFIRGDEMGMTSYRFIDRRDFPRFFGHTRNVTRFNFTARGVFSVGLSREQVEKVARRRIGTVTIDRSSGPGRERVEGDRVRIYSPAPFRPQVRNEQEVIQRERVDQRSFFKREPATPPDRIRGERGQVQPRNDRREPAVQPRNDRREPAVQPRNERNQPTVQPRGEVRSRQRQEVKPGRDTHEKAPQDRSKEKKGPGRGR